MIVTMQLLDELVFLMLGFAPHPNLPCNKQGVAPISDSVIGGK
jgi:hypothetical protein